MFEAIFSVFAFVIAGYTIKKTDILKEKITKSFDYISFNVLLPLALIAYFWEIEFPEINAFYLMSAFFGSGIIIFIAGFFISRKKLNLSIDDCALFGLGACFGNSVALGIPLVYSILGPINAMPYMILVFFHGFIHFSYTTVIIEGYRNRNHNYILIIVKTIFGLMKNIVLFGMFIGIFLNFSNISPPNAISNLLDPFSKIALPSVLISLGFGLASFKLHEHFKTALILTSLKNFLHPVIAFLLSKYLFQMDNLLIFIVTIAAALPSGSQSYYFSYRYNSLQNVISANIVLSTFVSFFTLSLLLMLFGYK